MANFLLKEKTEYCIELENRIGNLMQKIDNKNDK